VNFTKIRITLVGSTGFILILSIVYFELTALTNGQFELFASHLRTISANMLATAAAKRKLPAK